MIKKKTNSNQKNLYQIWHIYKKLKMDEIEKQISNL